MAGTAGVVQVVLAYLVLVGVVTTLALVPGVDPLGIGQVQGDPASPLSVFVALALGAFSLLAGLAGVRFGGWRPISILWSVQQRFRWELLRREAGWMLGLLAVGAVVGLLIGTGPADIGPRGSAGAVVGVLVLTLLLAPVRALGEEVVFRGIGQQGIGTWLKSPAWAILLPVPLSLIGAGALVGAALVSLGCGLLAWRTGGLELPFLLQLGTFGIVALLAPFGGPATPGAGASLAPMGLTVFLTVVIAWQRTGARHGLRFLVPVRRPADAAAPVAAEV
jgi:membrane protease YdiL (CAAX protease family)